LVVLLKLMEYVLNYAHSASKNAVVPTQNVNMAISSTKIHVPNVLTKL